MKRIPITARDIERMDDAEFRRVSGDPEALAAMTPDAERTARTRLEVKIALNNQQIRHFHEMQFTNYEFVEDFRQLAWTKVAPHKVKVKTNALDEVVLHADGRPDLVFPEGWPVGVDKDDFIEQWLTANGWPE